VDPWSGSATLLETLQQCNSKTCTVQVTEECRDILHLRMLDAKLTSCKNPCILHRPVQTIEFVIYPFHEGPVELNKANSSCMQMYDTTPLVKGVGEVFLDLRRKDRVTFFPFFPVGINCLLLIFKYFSDYFLVSMARYARKNWSRRGV